MNVLEWGMCSVPKHINVLRLHMLAWLHRMRHDDLGDVQLVELFAGAGAVTKGTVSPLLLDA